MIEVATFCSGAGSPEAAIEELGFEHKVVFACDIDKYAREAYLANFKPGLMFNDMTEPDYLGGGWYADIVIGGIPCQAFSLAGKRLGELDKRGLLFYDYYRYVKNQQPKIFIIENVKGLLSDNNGITFQNWCALMGQSMNTHLNMFNHPDSLLYNLHFTVLNSKDFGVPQNRERVFLVGIRNDLPNTFRFPKGERLTLKLKDILEPVVDEKYYLSDKMIEALLRHSETQTEKGNGFKTSFLDPNTVNTVNTVKANYHKMPGDADYIEEVSVAMERRTEEAKAQRRQTGSNDFRGKELVFKPADVMNCLQTGLTNDNLIMVKEATKKGYAIAEEGDSINLAQMDSETRRGRVGVANTLDTACNQAVVVKRRIRRLTPLECWRLQGFKDKYFYNAAKTLSDTQLYKRAGNSMTEKVMRGIIKNCLPILQQPAPVFKFGLFKR